VKQSSTRAFALLAISTAAWIASSVPSCGGGSSGGGPPPPVPDEPRDLLPTQNAPGVVVAIVAVDGGSGPGGFFRPGDRPRVRYTLLKKNGGRWNLPEMNAGSVMLSGPSFNYQRVIPQQTDVVARSVQQHDGSYVYTFADPIPATYLPPLNDSPSFGRDDGERTGDDLLDGTYTVGIGLAWDYTVSSQDFVDAGNATADFRLGGSAVLAHREAVNQDSCNRCHVDLRYHGDLWHDVVTCLMCHTSGAEDTNDPAIAGGTPGVSIDFRVLIHKLHNGRHLPSVLGVTTRPSGRRDYTAPPTPYVVADPDGTLHDYSTTGFPVWPNRTIPLFKDLGWSSLSPAEQAAEDTIRTGVADCEVCHGDPNPDCPGGPGGGPAQGGLAYSEPSIRSCLSCHDDWVPQYPYVANAPPAGMFAQVDSSLCKECHSPFDQHCSSGGLTVDGSHRHPLKDPFINHGLHLAIQSVAEAGANDGDGTIDPGEKIEIVFTMTDDAGADVPANQVASLSAVVAGPTTNSNQMLVSSIPKGLWSGTQPFRIRLPELRQLEFVGRSTAALGDVFTTSGAPHLNIPGALTSVRVRTATGPASGVLAGASDRPQNFLDLVDASAFARNDTVVVDDGGPGEEYATIQLVDGNRIWFSSPQSPAYPPGMAKSHAAGATVQKVTLVQKFAPADYTLDAATGTITEVTEFGAGAAVLVTYTTEFTMPRRYPLALNASPDLDETSGKWTGKDLVAGTYTVSITGYRDLTSQFNGETNVLYGTSAPATRDFLVGGATTLQPYALIDTPDNCYRCHTDIWFHDGKYRGFETCIACHGQAGSEDLPRYVAANAPATTGVTVNFRTLLHQIHRGKSLPDAATFEVVAAGPNAYPDNYTVASFAQYVYPPMPGATMHCAKCHGDLNTAWLEPADRNHPTEQVLPVLAWRAVCRACHDAANDDAHMAAYTSGGFESCDVCHAPGGVLPVDLAHKTR
jgi:hypothetical protein